MDNAPRTDLSSNDESGVRGPTLHGPDRETCEAPSSQREAS